MITSRTEKLVSKSSELGFTSVYFDNEFVILTSKNVKDLLKDIKKHKGKKIIFKPSDEKILRFAIEKTKIEMILGVEQINPKDSVHYLRGGVDQVSLRIMKEKGIVLAFSFSDILHSTNRARLLGRMMMNIRLARKYDVKTVFSTFGSAKELRSTHDLTSFWRVLGGK